MIVDWGSRQIQDKCSGCGIYVHINGRDVVHDYDRHKIWHRECFKKTVIEEIKE